MKLPTQSVPDPEVVQRHVDLQEKRKKDWDADLIQVEGKKGSTQGALFKDQRLNTVHYVKWPDSGLRPRVEALTGALYTLDDVPIPIQRVIDFKNHTAVMSDWLDDASPMTVAQLKQHPDVRRNIVANAWLAYWDVVGANGVNIVKGTGEKACRIDLGGSLLFRAMGGGKSLSPEVGKTKGKGVGQRVQHLQRLGRKVPLIRAIQAKAPDNIKWVLGLTVGSTSVHHASVLANASRAANEEMLAFTILSSSLPSV